MKCFTHRTQDAIGVCRACQKGLCAECAVDHGHALSCRGECETEVATIRTQNLAARRLVATQDKLLVAQKRARYLAPGFFIAAGLIFVIQDARDSRFSFISGLGVLFLLFGLGIFLANRSWLKASSKNGASDGATG